MSAPPGSRLALVRCVTAQAGVLALATVWRRLSLGASQTRQMATAYAVTWDQANRAALDGTTPLWAVLGDSAAQGVGASRHDRGYVGLVADELSRRDGVRWRVVNLSRSGARAADVLQTQLPALEALAAPPGLVTCVIGGNDMLRTPLPRLVRTFRALLSRLPEGAVVATVPQGLSRRRSDVVNAVVRTEAPAAGLRVADVWKHTGPPWRGKYAADMFHPNDVGYRDWARAILEALDPVGAG